MCDNKLFKALASIQEQITKFDNKANSLIALVSIVFVFSLGILDTFGEIQSLEEGSYNKITFIIFCVFSVVYFIIFLVDLTFLLLVIYPRKKRAGRMSINYYMDASRMNKSQILKNLNNSHEEDIDTQIDQIIINAKICKTKHKCLLVAMWLLIPLFICMFILFIIAIL